MKGVICAVIFAVCIARASALSCYKCDNCVLSGFLAIVENSETCSIFSTECRKTVAPDGSVSRGCATFAECAVTTLFTECSSPDEKGCVICCNSDNCNGAVAARATIFGLALACATAFLGGRL